MSPSGGQLILDLLSTLREGTMPVSALVEAGALFGISGNVIRVTLARQLAAGQIARDDRGRYRLGAMAQPVERRVRSWRTLDRATRGWDGGWIGIHHAAPAPTRRRREQEGRDRALRLFGFRTLAPGLSLRPDNLRTDLTALRDELETLGLAAGDQVFELRALASSTDARARTLWDARRLRATYRTHLRALAKSTPRLAMLAPEQAMVESFIQGRQVIRDLVLDPLLPDAICPTTERQALATALHHYDRLGRTAWAGFLKRFDVPHIRTPLDNPVAVEPTALAI
jgi:phenylacetic acid degradation operon negative regulatory protein